MQSAASKFIYPILQSACAVTALEKVTKQVAKRDLTLQALPIGVITYS